MRNLGARGLEFALDVGGHAAHLVGRGAEALRRLTEQIAEFGVGLFVGRAQRGGGAFALLAGGGAHVGELRFDETGCGLRRLGQERADVAGASLGLAEGFADQGAERAHDVLEIGAFGVDGRQQLVKRLVALAQRLVEFALRAGEFAGAQVQRALMLVDGFGQRGRVAQGAVGRVVQLLDLSGYGGQRGLEFAEAAGQRFLDVRQIGAGVAQHLLQGAVGGAELVEHRHHFVTDLVVDAGQATDRRIGAVFERAAQGQRRLFDRRSQLGLFVAEMFDNRRAAVFDRMRDRFADAGDFAGRLAAAGGEQFDEQRALGVEDVVQVGRTGRQRLVQVLSALAERLFDLAEAGGERRADFGDAGRERVSQFAGTAAQKIVDFVRRGCDGAANVGQARAELGVEVFRLRRERRVERARMRRQHAVDFRRALRELLKHGGAALFHAARDIVEASDDTGFKALDMAVERVGEILGAAVERRADLLDLRRQGVVQRVGVMQQRRVEFDRLGFERARNLAAAFGDRAGDVDGAGGERLGQGLRAGVEALVDPVEQCGEGLRRLFGLLARALLEIADVAVEQRGALFEVGVDLRHQAGQRLADRSDVLRGAIFEGLRLGCEGLRGVAGVGGEFLVEGRALVGHDIVDGGEMGANLRRQAFGFRRETAGDFRAMVQHGGFESVQTFGQRLVDAVAMHGDGHDGLAGGGGEAIVQAVRMAGQRVHRRLRDIGEARMQLFAVLGEIVAHAGVALLDQTGERNARRAEALMRGVGLLGDELGDALSGVVQALVQLFAMDIDDFVEAVAGFDQAGGEAVAARGNGLGDARAGFVDALGDFLPTRAKIENQRFAGALQARVHFGDALRQGLRDRFGGVGEIGRHLRAGVGQAAQDVRAAFGERIDQRVAGRAERRGDFLALDAERCRHLVAGGGDAGDDAVGYAVEILGESFMRAGDGAAHAVGVGDDRLAFAGEFVDQRPHAAFVVGVGAFEIGDFGANHGFQFAGARDGALDAVAHRGDFAANGLRQRDDLLGGDRLGFGEAHGDFGHRAGGGAHLLRAAHQQAGDDEEGGGTEQREHQQRGFGTAEERAFARPAARGGKCVKRPEQRPERGERHADNHGRRADARLQGLQNLTDMGAVVVGGRAGGERRGRRRGRLGGLRRSGFRSGRSRLGGRRFGLRQMDVLNSRQARRRGLGRRLRRLDFEFGALRRGALRQRLGRLRFGLDRRFGLRGVVEIRQAQSFLDRR